MDPLSVAASLSNLIEAISASYSFLRAIKNAPFERKRLLLELSSLRGMLQTLKDFTDIEEDRSEWLRSVKELHVNEGPVHQLQRALDQLNAKIGPTHGLESAARILLWKPISENVKDLIAQVERLKALVQLALEFDHTGLLLGIKSSVDSMKNSFDKREYLSLLQWLSPANYESHLQKNVNLRHKGTAEWFVKHPGYLDWLSGGTRTLFCPGNPGAGKSVISATVFSQLRKTFDSPTQPTIYLCCDYQSRAAQTVGGFLGDLVRQLVHAKGPTSDLLSAVYEMQRRHEAFQSRPSIDDWKETLLELLSNCTQVFMVIDALDECEDTVRTELLAVLRPLQADYALRLLATSRPIPAVCGLFSGDKQIVICASESDIRTYARSRIFDCRVHGAQDLRIAEKIADAVVHSADGAFLLARLHMDSLNAKNSMRSLMETVTCLPSGSDAAYEAAMTRIDNQSAEDSKLARSALEWIVLARKPLRLSELQHALAIRDYDEKLELSGIYDAETLLNVCQGLLTVVREMLVTPYHQDTSKGERSSEAFIRLVHFTTKEYLERTMLQWFPQGHLNIAKTCLTYLSFETFRSGSFQTEAEVQELLEKFVLYEYAARNWGCHAKHVENLNDETQFDALLDVLESFLQQTQLLDLTERVREATMSWISVKLYATGLHAFHEIARFDLVRTCKFFLNKNYDTARRSSRGDTALHTAATSGSKGVLSVLIGVEAVDANARKDYFGSTPLINATVRGNLECVALLLRSGKADINAWSRYGRSALSSAARAGHEDIAELLLKHPLIDVNHKDIWKDTPLAIAFRNGHEQVVKQLLTSSKLTSSDEVWATEKLKHLPPQLSRVCLYHLLKRAYIHEASWRRRNTLTDYANRGPGTCWFLAEKIWRCPGLEPTGGCRCGSDCFCCELREHCRTYVSNCPLIGTDNKDEIERDWFERFLDALRPWLLCDEEVLKSITVVTYSILTGYRFGNIICDICAAVGMNAGYHCDQCRDNNFDVCIDCVDRGFWCLDETHVMWIYRATISDESIQLANRPTQWLVQGQDEAIENVQAP